MHSVWTLSSGEGSLEAFSIRYCTACFASLSQTGFLLALLSLGTICLLYYLSRPLNLIYDLTGAKGDKYFKLPAKNDAMAKEHLKGRLQRKSGKSIPVYPNGWFGILESSEIGRNEVKYVMALAQNYVLPAGATAVIYPFFTHYDTELWPEPNKFNPDNFTAEKMANRHKYAFLPFSGGARGCIGNKFAMITMKTTLSIFIRQFRVSTTKKLEDIEVYMDLVLRCKGDWNMKLERRINQKS
ncbi:probable cytochrome P450 313a1 [Bemisia tabaci]|uniref:probable cytochrome P450 313a1 n=1 Tax=Bemisia tabaci TaxID=7038 RepID=UPI003B283C9D